MKNMVPSNSASQFTCNELRDECKSPPLRQKHNVFLSHSGAQKAFVEHLCVDLERCLRFPFFDKRQESLPIGKHFPELIFDAIQQCTVGVIILSEGFLTSKWPMMEFVAMVDHARKNSTFTIIPVYFRISIEEFKDDSHRNRWLSCWQDFALEDPRSVNIGNWMDAMKYIQPINSPKYDGLSELKLLNEVVDAVCKLVPAEVKLEDSYIQGRSRLCQVIHEKIDMEQGSRACGVSIVGLYGMGGIGKTSICKALCNENSIKFRGRVCLVELEKKNEEESLREVVQSLSDRSQFYGLNFYQLQNGLREGTLIKNAVFLVLDNMIDSHISMKQVDQYLSAKLPSGSVVMVTTRSKELLLNMRKYFNPNNCMEMPELNLEEAKALFVKSCNFGDEETINDRLIERCVLRCCFQKDDLYKSDHSFYQGYQNYPIYNDDEDNDNYYLRIRQYAHHYHPLALEVLGREFGQIARSLWNRQLRNIDEDIFNQTRGNIHPIFSILRKSFDTLSQEDQLLFMDVALFLHHPVESGCNVFEWLRVVHNIPNIDNVKTRLEKLKTKSLLERLHDGTNTRIGMHDLWRSFCVAETKYGKLKSHRWAYVASRTSCALLYTTPSGIWENVQRMAFMGYSGYTSTPLDSPLIIENALRLLNFAHFSNVLVLKMLDLSIKEIIEVDLSGLIHLKTFEVSGNYLDMLGIRGLPRSLIFLSFIWGELKVQDSAFTRYLLKQIEALKELEYLQLINHGGEKLPNLSNMVNLRKVIFRNCKNVVTLSGLRSKESKLRIKNFLPKAFQRHTSAAKQSKFCSNFQVLDVQGCIKLQSCSGIGDLVALEELNCKDCVKLEKLPHLRRLTRLKKLNIHNCYKISELLGLGELGALVELHAGLSEKISTVFKVPILHNLRNLQVLQFENRRLDGALEFDKLHSLREVVVEFQSPMSFQVSMLERLKIGGCSLAELRELCKLTMLEILEIGSCKEVNELPNLSTLDNLQSLKIVNCNFKDVCGLSNLSALVRLQIEGCHHLESIPDLLKLTRLKTLEISSCSLLKGLNSTTTTKVLTSMDLQSLKIWHCQGLGDMISIEAFSQLETLECWECGVIELPNLSNFHRLKNLILWKCEALETLTTNEPINSLSILLVHGCGRLVTLPDLCNFPALLELKLEEGKVSKPVTTLACSVPLTMLQLLLLHCETTLQEIDIGVYFPAVKEIDIQGGLKTLSSNVPVTALQVLKLSNCLNLTTIPYLKMFPALRSLDLFRCRRLLRLHSADHVPLLQEVDARECLSLSPDDLYQIQVLCQECNIKYKDN